MEIMSDIAGKSYFKIDTMAVLDAPLNFLLVPPNILWLELGR